MTNKTSYPNRLIPPVKKCVKCQETKKAEAFRKSMKYSTGLTSWCKSCLNANNKIWGKINIESKRNSNLKAKAKKYGISLEEYKCLVQTQNNKCAICSSTQEKTRLAIDHCHKTLKVRGLLCDLCNRGLGFFRDSADRLSKAIEYLKVNKNG